MVRRKTDNVISFGHEPLVVETFDNVGIPFTMKAPGLHISKSYHSLYLAYSGEKAGDSYAKLQIPTDSEFLRKFAKMLNALADELDS
ncbi:TPA: hypothetical protein MO340_004300 [Salmonella enterica subsp. salamae serovar 35:g,m,s,t:-]|nr:hypothetical protein [Salmonella enterica subsp. salamae serovar 35:g,m,s,t:-]HCA3549770.1 hypothetical protein [Salmonella enterica subsp. salamae serovar 35:g,m,s,t:-]